MSDCHQIQATAPEEWEENCVSMCQGIKERLENLPEFLF